MSAKLTVIYRNPDDPASFEKHYHDVHVPMVAHVKGVERAEFAKVFPKEDGTPTPAYRVAELYFKDYDSACAALSSPEGQALAGDAVQLGRAGVEFLLCEVE